MVMHHMPILNLIHYHSAQVTHLKLIVALLGRRHSVGCYPTGNDLLLLKACVMVPRLLTVGEEICHNNSQGLKRLSTLIDLLELELVKWL